MRIKDIHIENFRGLQNVTLEALSPNLNLIVGINGAGKSSILDAVALVLSWFIARVQSKGGRGKEIPLEDISNGSRRGCLIKLDLNNEGEWELFRSKSYNKERKSQLENISKFAGLLREELDHNPKFPLPIVVHYGVDRTVLNRNTEGNNRQTNTDQLEAYKNALNGKVNFNEFFQWFRNEEDYENEIRIKNNDFRDPSLETIRKALKTALPEFTDLKVSRKKKALVVQKNGKEFQINQLSDGEKVYITLICDIARRLAIANPSGDALHGEGIVLIDEVDLHLHPQWQLSIVSTLEQVFPNIQFLLSSHSSIVASDTKGKVFGIKNGEIVTERTYGKLSEDILSYVFGVSNARSPYIQQLINRSYELIEKGDSESFEDNLKNLSKLIGADDMAISMLKLEKLRRERYPKS